MKNVLITGGSWPLLLVLLLAIWVVYYLRREIKQVWGQRGPRPRVFCKDCMHRREARCLATVDQLYVDYVTGETRPHTAFCVLRNSNGMCRLYEAKAE